MKYIFTGIIFLALTACISLPDIYLIDRHTVMEAEASGEWPQLEERFRQTALSKGPTNLAEEPSGRRRERAFRVLNGEFTTASSPAVSTPTKSTKIQQSATGHPPQ